MISFFFLELIALGNSRLSKLWFESQLLFYFFGEKDVGSAFLSVVE